MEGAKTFCLAPLPPTMAEPLHPQEDHKADTPPVDRTVRLTALIDLYGPLLTDRQLEFIRLHFEEDLSFGEISREYSISRQAVHDAVKHAEKALEEYEAKLGLLGRGGKGPGEAPREAPPTMPTPEMPVGGLAPAIRRLEDILGRLERSGGILYNAEGLAREIRELIGELRRVETGPETQGS